MTVLSSQSVEAILQETLTPDGKSNLLEAGVISALNITEDSVRFVIEVAGEEVKAYQPLRNDLEAKLEALEGAKRVMVGLSAQMPQGSAMPKSQPASSSAEPKIQTKQPVNNPEPIKGVKHVVLVGSGKGGVGKSTVAVNLALALSKLGMKTGLLDGDIFGPSQPKMLDAYDKPQMASDGKTLIPLEKYGLKMMSLGLMVEEGKAVVWRGPMLMSALQQMTHQVDWGELDVLIVDLPPGTGDVQLSLAQKVTLSGAVIVSTPQDVALIDARKAIDMFNRLNVPILGMIENMSTHICSNCGHEEHIFGHQGVAKESQNLGFDLLGEVPLHLRIRESGDNGKPIVEESPDAPYTRAFMDIAYHLRGALS